MNVRYVAAVPPPAASLLVGGAHISLTALADPSRRPSFLPDRHTDTPAGATRQATTR